MRSSCVQETKKFSCCLLITAFIALPVLATKRIHAQEDSVRLEVSAADRVAAAYSASNFRYHMYAANTQSGKAALSARNLGTPLTKTRSTSTTATTSTITSVPSPGFYPDDMVYFGGKFLTGAKSHPIFVNTSSCGTVATCWGNPVLFLNDLNNSSFIHITDQYVGTTLSARYPAGPTASANMPLFVSNVLGQNDILSIVHNAAKNLGPGYGHIYHVFLPSGVDTCFDLTSVCYSPDNFSTFFFCAYHASVTFSDIGHVVFTVLPYQNVPGCQVAPPTPNSTLIDSTNSVLSHELIEAITDPDPSTGWISASSAATAGFEIADICQPLGNFNGQALDPTVTLNGKKYELQLEYGNNYHACTAVP